MNDFPLKLRFSWRTALAIAVSGAALWLAFRRIDVPELAAALRGARGPWLLAAMGMFGLGGVFAATRYFMMLSVTGADVHPGAALRIFFIGHFFNLLLFGPAAGDVAKSALYARWYRIPLPKVVAAAPLDRLLGFCGLMIFVGLGLAAGALSGAFADIEIDAGISTPWIFWGATLILTAVAALAFWRPESESVLALIWSAFRDGVKTLLGDPGRAALGVALGFAVQAVIGLTLAFCLKAVSSQPVALLSMVWVFPAISILTSLPSVAGLGLRETAALALLGLYGVAGADAVAASLLFMVCHLCWAAFGGRLFWSEIKNFHTAAELRRRPSSISVVIPTLNEQDALPETLKRLKAIPEAMEVIVADGGSRDSTLSIAKDAGCRTVTAPVGRGNQMRAGAAVAGGDVILLLHADTWLPANAGAAALRCLNDPTVVGGGYWKDFRDGTWLMSGSRWRCALRLFLSRRIAGDQGFFIRRETLEKIGGVPEIPLMEEFRLCDLLNKEGRLALAGATVTTSARRFLKAGPLRTYLCMWRVTVLYRLGVAPERLRRIYEKL